MTGAAASVLVACDGFRGSGALDAPPLVGARPTVDSLVADRWCGPGDSLRRRRDRLAARCAELPHGARVHLVGLSMGCQVGVHLLVELLADRSDLTVGQVVLVAPDPKLVPSGRDRAETGAGERSAYDEAAELWGATTPGEAMVPATCAVLAGAERGRLVVCRTDGVVGWSANGERLVAACRPLPGVAVVEAIDGARVWAHGLDVDLRGGADAQGVARDVHDRLAGAIRPAPAPLGGGPPW